MALPPPRRTRERGFALLAALGITLALTVTVAMTVRAVSREANVQGDLRRQKEAFFAAEAGLAEGREAMRLLLADSETYNPVLAQLGSPVTEPGLGSSTQPWYEVLPSGSSDGWNAYPLTPESMTPAELSSARGEAYADYPRQANVRYRVFVHDDGDDADFTTDSNRQVWLVAVGEVVGGSGRPTRSVVQALITNDNELQLTGPGCVNRGCGPNNTFNNTLDRQAPPTQTVRFF
ncbi:pilus assembly PilX N-terminal domain-containing protein [Corallococcus interemptor]|uniref:pilus assembly PilX N-terminal domain-containing protein n=1 Tax=Corallococcus interemptor TaxID=2316720 RepID=UPI003D0096F9